jgi:hypothetical protein
MHGGAAPQVQRSARLRIAELEDPAIGALGRALKPRRVTRTGFYAARYVLDQTIGRAPLALHHSGPGGAPIQVQATAFDYRLATNEELDEVRAHYAVIQTIQQRIAQRALDAAKPIETTDTNDAE